MHAHGHVRLLTDINGSVTDELPINRLCHFTYDDQFLTNFPPLLDDLHSFSAEAYPPDPSSPKCLTLTRSL